MPTRRAVALLLCLGIAAACQHRSGTSTPALPSRSYQMGFSWYPPRPEIPLALQVIDLFTARADAGLIAVSPPWLSLINGANPITLVTSNELGLANYYRSHGLSVIVSIDPTDGLDRSRDAPDLVASGRSLAEPAIQQLFVDYSVAMATLLQPEYQSIASETNLVRSLASPALYAGVRSAANAAATAIATVNAEVKSFITVQVELAWGLPGGSYVGITQDLTDFPFTAAIGLSSYPFLAGISDPEQLPDDYYERIGLGTGLSVLMIEGGWPSVPTAGVAADPPMQARFITRVEQLLDRAGAIGWFQISFTDLEVNAYSPGVAPFANLGLVTAGLAAKPALAPWDAVFARPRR